MNDPGLPPRKPRSLNLLESLVKEEEEKAREQEASLSIVLPSEGNISGSGEFYDASKQQIAREPSASSFSEFRMKDSGSEANKQAKKGNPTAGFKGRKLYKQGQGFENSEFKKMKSKQRTRPSSASVGNTKKKNSTNGRPKTSHGSRGTLSPKGNRSRSPRRHSSESNSSEEAFGRRETRRKSSPVRDSFFDSDCGGSYVSKGKRRDNSRGSDSSRSRSRSRSSSSSRSGSSSSSGSRRRSSSPGKARSRSSSSSLSYTSNDDKPSTSKQKPEVIQTRINVTNRKLSVNKQNDQAKKQRTNSESSDLQNFVIVEDNSSSFFSSDNEKPVQRKPPKPKEQPPLLSRKKKQTLKLYQISPDLYLEGKLQQKYSELEELMECSFVDQRSHMTRRHLYQMEVLRDQYESLNHRGRPSSAVSVPQSHSSDARNTRQRPSSGHMPRSRVPHREDESSAAYSTIRSVMVAEHARGANIIRTDLVADRGRRCKQKKKKKPVENVSKKDSDSDEETSEKPSVSSKTSGGSGRSGSAPSTPGRAPAVDDHIKYSENEKLRKWLKEKDKIYRKTVRAERKKKREEREVAINNANEKLEKRIESQKIVKKWMHVKNKELYKKHKEERKQMEAERKEWEKIQVNLPGSSIQIKQQKVKRESASEHSELHDEIRKKQEAEEEKKQEKLAHNGAPHPPQTKFIYKRPVAGKIKLNMQVRGKSPVPQRPDSAKSNAESDSESAKAQLARLSYDEWIKKKAVDDAAKKKEAERKRELARSDPELERGADSDGNRQRPRSAYKLESDKEGPEEPALSVKPLKRPSTAPAARGRVPPPKQSSKSPRKAIIPQKMDNETGQGTIPFPPEKGVPAHVAEKQKQIFADQITQNLNKIEQEALMNAELTKEGVSTADIEKIERTSLEEFESKMAAQAKAEKEAEEAKKASINELMYSPRKKEESPESSEDENSKDKTKEKEEDCAEKATSKAEAQPAMEQSHYKTFSDLSDLSIDAKSEERKAGDNKTDDGLNIDIEQLRERVEALKDNSSLTIQPSFFDDSNDYYDGREESSQDGSVEHSYEERKIEVINNSATDQPIVGILKDTKKTDEIPVPKPSEEPVEVKPEDKENAENDAPDALDASKRRVSFNERTEVFESFETTSTATNTPEPEEFYPSAESLENQPNYYVDEPNMDESNDAPVADGEKVSFNIGGFELNPTVLEKADDDDTNGTEVQEDESPSTFITDPS